jgi:O-antigen/teichoic acid export membrane protein
LESSTIVWVSGLDSFVRLVSQNSFDRLAHDYSFLQIFTILIGLGIAVYVFKFMSHRKALNEKWK